MSGVCTDSSVDPDIFFDDLRVAEAKALCAGCSFSDQCREIARSQRLEYGVFGGEDEYERAAWLTRTSITGETKLCRRLLHEMTPENQYRIASRPQVVTCRACKRETQRRHDLTRRDKNATGSRKAA